MGSSVSCGCANSTVVQVKQTNGFAQEFRKTATVGHVMELNPDHLVVRYTRRNRGKEKGQPRITILNPDQRLIPGKTYLLYPIPEQYRKDPCHNPFLPSVDRADEEKMRRRALRKLEAAIELQKPKLMSFQWKPSLDSIPESPPFFSRRASMGSPLKHEGAYQTLRVSSPSRLSLSFPSPSRLSVSSPSPSRLSPDKPLQGRRAHQVTQRKKQSRWIHPRTRCFFLLTQDIKRSRSLPNPGEKISRFPTASDTRIYLSPHSEQARRRFMRHTEADD